MKKPISVQVTFDLKGAYKQTKYDDGSIKGERITGEEAALDHAEQGGF